MGMIGKSFVAFHSGVNFVLDAQDLTSHFINTPYTALHVDKDESARHVLESDISELLGVHERNQTGDALLAHCNADRLASGILHYGGATAYYLSLSARPLDY